jgi:serine/threonine protein kinase/Tfp pilus assembly protein PilF
MGEQNPTGVTGESSGASESPTSGATSGISRAMLGSGRGGSGSGGGLGRADGGGAFERPGDRVGPYTLVSVLGEGGFGTVWLAERREPMVQRVALKLLKPGMDSRSVLARFEQERQALAVMDHPNVARVFDGGVSDLGRSYFVMELVRGESITAYSDRHTLTVRQRLELFIPVCEAVHHAHMKGIIHRDLKPSNVLVAESEGRAIAKVIDFGIAKATEASGVQHAVFSTEGVLIGTPEYMSPEQAGGGVDIDTRTDVYSLGVLLYELLVGAQPFDGRALRGRGYAEIQRIIREDEPPRPSTRLVGVGDAATEIAARRGDSRESLVRELRRELEWIPMKAMRKERERRYGSAAALGEDLRRYLDGRALDAAPESRVYLARKFVSRNRVMVGAGSAIFVALVAGLAGTLWQGREAARQAARADDRATAAMKAEAEASDARDAERSRADELEKVAGFQQRMLAQVDATTAGVRLTEDVSRRFGEAMESMPGSVEERAARAEAFRQEWLRINATDVATALIDQTILAPSADAITQQFADQPLVEARLRQALSDRYRDLGLFEAGVEQQVRAYEIRRVELGEDHALTIESMSGLGVLLGMQGKLSEAAPMYAGALERARRSLGEDDPLTMSAMANMGYLLQIQGKLAEAEPVYRETHERRRRVLGAQHPDTITSLSNVASLIENMGRLAEAEAMHREVLASCRGALGDDHRETITSMNNLGAALAFQGKLSEAEPFWREALERKRRVLGEDHPDMVLSLNNMGFLLFQQGKREEAAAHFAEALEKARRVLGADHPHTLGLMNNTAHLLSSLGRTEEAEAYMVEVVERKRRVLGIEHPDTLVSVNNLGAEYLDQGRYAEAEPYLREALAGRRRVIGDTHINTVISAMNVGLLLRATERQAEVIQIMGPFLAHARAAMIESNTPLLGRFLLTLGGSLVDLGPDAERWSEAEPMLVEAHRLLTGANGPGDADAVACVEMLVRVYESWEAAEPGKGHAERAAVWRARLPEPERGPE